MPLITKPGYSLQTLIQHAETESTLSSTKNTKITVHTNSVAYDSQPRQQSGKKV